MPRGGPNDPGTRCRMIKADGSRFELTAAKSKNADGYCYQHMGAQRRRTWGAIKRVRSGYHATDDSSLPSAGRGMTRMHNLCAQRQRAIDMKVSHIAPGGLRPSAMHEPREISKQTNKQPLRAGDLCTLRRRPWSNAPEDVGDGRPIPTPRVGASRSFNDLEQATPRSELHVRATVTPPRPRCNDRDL